MNDEASFTQAMLRNPEDTTLRLVFADWLEERGDPRAELLRLLHTLTQTVEVPETVRATPNSLFRRILSSISFVRKGARIQSERRKLENRLRSLMVSGVQPVGPFITNSIGMKFAWIPAGTFLMGSPENEEERENEGTDEFQHQVTLSKGFYLAIHPVTQASWRTVMGNNPSHSQPPWLPMRQGDDLPVTDISWDDCQEFLQKLSEEDGHAYRLPTEAEWEYSCRAGTTTPFYFGETISTDQANYNGNSSYGNGKKGVDREITTSVDSFPSNAWGLHDMHGNVWEWCWDWYGDYPRSAVVDPQGPANGENRVRRGGSFTVVAMLVRSAGREMYLPECRTYNIGFRAARTFP